MEQLIFDALSFYRRELMEGNNKGIEFLKNEGLFDARMIEKLKLGWSGGALIKTLGPKQKKTLKRLGLIKSGNEIFKNSLVMPVFNTNGECVDLFGIRIRSTDIRTVLYKSEPQGIIGAETLKSYSEVIFSEFIMYYLWVQVNGFENVISAREKNECFKLVNDLDNHGVSRVHYVGQKYRKQVIPLMQNKGMMVTTVPVDGRKVRIEELQKLKKPRAKENVSVIRETDAHIFFKSDSTTVRVDNAVILIPTKRCLVRIDRGERSFIDSLCFSSSTARAKYSKAAATKLNLSASCLDKLLEEITECVDRLHEERSEDEKIYTITETEENEAKKILKKKDILTFMSDTIEDELGFVGNVEAIKIGILTATSRLLPKPASMFIRGNASSGKSFLMNCISQLFPEEQILYFSKLTPASLLYMKDGGLQERIIVIDEFSGIQNKKTEYLFRSLMESGVLSVARAANESGGMQTKVITIKTKVAVMISSTKTIEPELLSRFLLVELHSSEKQNKQVMLSMAKGKAAGSRVRIAKNINHLLKGYPVEVPFAGQLVLDGGNVQVRRRFAQILALIRSHALLHQFQRVFKDNVLIASIDDYRAVYPLLNFLVDHVDDEISANGMTLLRYLKREKKQQFTLEEIMKKLSWCYSKCWRTLKELEKLDIVVADSNKNGVKRLFTLQNYHNTSTGIDLLKPPDEIEG